MAGGASRLSGLQFRNPHRPVDGSPAWRHRVVRAGGAVPLPGSPGALEAEVAGAGRVWSLPEWGRATTGTSLVVLDRGEVVHEWYADGVDPGDLFLGASMTKSALAHLVGLAVGAGSLRVEDAVVEHVPELRGSGYDGCSVLHLLTMTTGVDAVEDHRDPTSFASRLLATFSEPDGDSRALLGTVGRRHPPGTQYEYCTGDSQVLDWVRERATGSTYDVALEGLWSLLGCTSDAVVGVDGRGVALAGGALAATARDWARVGRLQVDGTAQGARVLGTSWVDRSSTPALAFLAPGRLPSSITTHAGFGFHWWPLVDSGRQVTADGSRGQFAYVDRDADVVVVKTSQWPYDDWLADRQSRDLSYLGLPVVARAAVLARAGQRAG
jgi:CubicO group peptidase (beta-lactamase class C family)